jgi:hypothetical protein
MMTAINFNMINIKLLGGGLPLRLRPAVRVHDLLLVVAQVVLPELPHLAEGVRKAEGRVAGGLHLLEKPVAQQCIVFFVHNAISGLEHELIYRGVYNIGHHMLLLLGVVEWGEGTRPLGIDTLYMYSLIDASLQGVH